MTVEVSYLSPSPPVFPSTQISFEPSPSPHSAYGNIHLTLSTIQPYTINSKCLVRHEAIIAKLTDDLTKAIIMPSSSDHNTDKERRLIGVFIYTHVRLHHADEHFLNLHLTSAFAAVLELGEEDLECQLEDKYGQEMVLAEEDRIARWKERTRSGLVHSAAELVEDVARETVGEFGVAQQEVIFQLAWDMYAVAKKLKAPKIDYMTVDDDWV